MVGSTRTALPGGLLALFTLALSAAALAGDPYLVRDIKVKPESSSSPSQMREALGKLFFTAHTHDHGHELWMTDPATGTTTMLRDINPGIGGSNPYPALETGGRLYFQATDEDHGTELWWTDGTTTGLLVDMSPGPGSSNASPLVVAGDTIYLRGYHPDYGYELWKTDGTTTALVADLDPSYGIYGTPNSSSPSHLATVGNTLYFAVRVQDEGKIWKTTAGSTSGSFVPIATSGAALTSASGMLGVINDEVFFMGTGTLNGEETGYELWKVTPAGVELVKDFLPGQYTYESGGNTYSYPNSGYPRLIAQVGAYIYVSADGLDGTGAETGTELWRVSTSGVDLIEIYPGTTSYVHATNGQTYTSVNEGNPAYFAEVGGKLIITANGLDGNGVMTGKELWVVSGATAALLKDIRPGEYPNTYSGQTYAYSSSPTLMTIHDDVAYFSATSPTVGREVFETDGTVAGTKLYKDLRPGVDSSSPYGVLGTVDGKTVFRARDDAGLEPWTADWAAGTATRLMDINPGSGNSMGYGIYYLWNEGHVVNGVLVFNAYAPSTGKELYYTNGTPSGTAFLFEAVDGPRDGINQYSGSYGYPTVVGGKLFFSGDDLEIGRELYWSDGTPGGTDLLKDIEETGGSSSSPYKLTQVGPHTIFVANDGYHDAAHGREWWVTDGTKDGTELLKDIRPGWRDSNIYYGFDVHFGDKYLFRANDGTHGDELWVTDGTKDGTKLLEDIRQGSGGSYPYYLGTAHGYAYFRANDAVNGNELWRTQATVGSTELLDIWPGVTTYTRLSDGYQYTYTNSSTPYLLAVAGDNLYLRAQGYDDNGDPTGYEIWKATPSGVSLVVDMYPGTYTNSYYDRVYGNSSSPYFMGNLPDGRFLFRATTADGLKLFSLDPADDSVAELDSLDGYMYPLEEVDGLIYFRGNGTVNGELSGNELWATDGSVGGLRLVKDLAPGTYEYNDNTYPNSSNPYLIAALDGKLIFRATSTTYGQEPFVSDGTPGGTDILLDIFPGGWTDSDGVFHPAGSGAQLMNVYNGEVYFHAQDPYHWIEIWKTDGTTANTGMLGNIFTSNSYSYTSGVLAHGLLYFRGHDDTYGYELWRTDGSEEGTVLVSDIVPGPFHSYANPLGAIGTTLYLNVDDGIHGYELWAMEPEPIFAVDFFPDGHDLDWVALKPMEFTVRASDYDGDTLTLTGTLNGQAIGEIGPGATMTAPSGANPVSSTFSWTPEVADAGNYVLEFTVSDGAGGNVVTYTLNITVAGDTDGDGLPDYWETDGYTKFGEFVDLPNLTGMFQTSGSDPTVPDIFVEIDYMENETVSLRPFNQAIQWIVQSFADRGISLHVIVDDAVPHLPSIGPDPDFYDWTEFDNYKDAFFTPGHRAAFRYCLFASNLGPTTNSGIARNVIGEDTAGASDFIVSLGSWTNGTGTQEEQAGTFMHELGHTLGLQHGGGDNEKNKPNYISVMNYLFQHGLLVEGLSAGEEYKMFNYSVQPLADLSEVSLNEGDGLRTFTVSGNNKVTYDTVPELEGYGTKWYLYGLLRETPAGIDVNDPIDWNGDGDTDDTIPSNLNNLGGYTTLKSHDDWSSMKYTGGLVGGAGIPLPEVTESEELPIEEVREVFPEPPPNPNPPVAVAYVASAAYVTGSEGLAEIVLDGSGSYDPDGDAITHWWYEGENFLGHGETLTATFGPGQHLVSLRVEDQSLASEPTEVSFEVLSSLAIVISATPSVIWSPNHDLVPVKLNVSPASLSCTITGVTSNEAIDGPGDGSTDPDWELTADPLQVMLRAERSGKGSSRIYEVQYECTDTVGRIFTGAVQVTVPHDKKDYKELIPSDAGEDASSGEEPPPAASSTGEESASTSSSTESTEPETVGETTTTSSSSSSSEQPTALSGEGEGTAPETVGDTGSSDAASSDTSSDTSSTDTSSTDTSSTDTSSTDTSSTDTSSTDTSSTDTGTPSLDGGEQVEEEAGDTNGGTEPAGAGNDGPDGGVGEEELSTGS